MPSGKNWVNFLYVNLAFAIYVSAVFYYSQAAEIKKNWPLYRCNPMYMPLADNIEENFVYCVQSIQKNFMGHLLQPLSFATGSISNSLGGFMEDINNVRAMFNKIRTFFSNIVQSIFGVFLNLIIEFQKITIGIKDLMGKTIGIMVSLLYVMDGSVKTMQSSWNGPPGQLVRSLGKCFHPNTNIKLKNGTIKLIKNISLGDILEDESFVNSIMIIDNEREPVPLYVIENSGVNGENIYVTGSHLVFDKSQEKFVRVENYNKAKIDTSISVDCFICLITSKNKILIGNELFWDWEDHFVKN